MAGPLKWILELYDKVSGPAEKMAKATEHFDHSMHKAAGSTEKMAKAQKELSAERIAIMTELAHQGAEAIDALAEKVVEFGKELLHAADYARTTGIIFESLAGSSEGGKRLFETAEEYASKAGIKIAEAVDIFRTLSTGGIKDTGQNFAILAQAAGDIGLKTKTSAASVAQVFADIQSKGQLTGLQLRSFVGAIPMEELAKRLGVASGSFHELQQQLNQSPVSAQKGIQAILDTLSKTEGGTLGDITKRVGEGFEGMSNRVANAWDRALEHFAKTEGFQRVLELMDRIAKRLEDPAFGKSMSDFATSLVHVAEALERIIPTIQGVKQQGFLGAIFGQTAFEANKNMIQGYGRQRADGTWEMVGKTNAQEMNKGFQEGIEAHSPSKVYERFGRYSAEGFNLGFEDHRDDDLGVPGGKPLTGARAGGHHVEINQAFHVSGTQGMDVEALAHRVAELSATALQSPLETLAISMGQM